MHNYIKKNPQKHLPFTNTNLNALYLYNKEIYTKFGFNCPYAPNSPTYFIKERLKVNSTLVPIGLLNTQELKFNECFPKLKNKQPNLVLLIKAYSP